MSGVPLHLVQLTIDLMITSVSSYRHAVQQWWMIYLYTVYVTLNTAHNRRCWQAASQVSHTATDGNATTSAIHCWPQSIHCARHHRLQLLAGRPPRTAGLWVL